MLGYDTVKIAVYNNVSRVGFNLGPKQQYYLFEFEISVSVLDHSAIMAGSIVYISSRNGRWFSSLHSCTHSAQKFTLFYMLPSFWPPYR